MERIESNTQVIFENEDVAVSLHGRNWVHFVSNQDRSGRPAIRVKINGVGVMNTFAGIQGLSKGLCVCPRADIWVTPSELELISMRAAIYWALEDLKE